MLAPIKWLGFKSDDGRYGPAYYELIFSKTGGNAHALRINVYYVRRILTLILISFIASLVFMGYMSVERRNLQSEIAALEDTKKKMAELETAKKQAAIHNASILSDYTVLASQLYDVEQKVNQLNQREQKRLNGSKASISAPLASEKLKPAGLTGVGGDTSTDSEAVKKWLLSNAPQQMDKLDKQLNQLLAVPNGLPLTKNTFRLSSPFGYRNNPFSGQGSEFHNGLDFAAPQGTPIYATAAGSVEYAEKRGGLGNAVKINHGYGFDTAFGHMSKILVRSGSRVDAGDLIGLVGSTGRSSGPHLHYIVYYNGSAIDPHGFI